MIHSIESIRQLINSIKVSGDSEIVLEKLCKICEKEKEYMFSDNAGKLRFYIK